VLLFPLGTSKVNSSRIKNGISLQLERDSKINVTMPAGHTLPLTFAFDFTASYFRISSVVPEPEPVILSGSGSGSDLNLVVRPGPVPVPHPWFVRVQFNGAIRYDTTRDVILTCAH